MKFKILPKRRTYNLHRKDIVARAMHISTHAAKYGFDWNKPEDVLDKLCEEIEEIRDALQNPHYPHHLDDEIGDLFFALVNFARKANIPPQKAFQRGVSKFERRFNALKKLAFCASLRLQSLDANALDALWTRVKSEENTP